LHRHHCRPCHHRHSRCHSLDHPHRHHHDSPKLEDVLASSFRWSPLASYPNILLSSHPWCWWEYALEAIIKLYYSIFLLFRINVYISCYNCLLVPNMSFGGKSNYTCGIINNKEFPNLASKISLLVIR
jgi:hypothetical protein